MKVLFISDIHGKTDWAWVVEEVLKFDKIVFLGDYVDSFTVPNTQILDNLKSIIKFKKKYSDIVELLLGNHDYAYLFYKPMTSGFRQEMYFDIKDLFESNWELFNVAWGYQGTNKYTLATHAGLTQTYMDDVVYEIAQTPGTLLYRIYRGNTLNVPIHEILNYLKDNNEALWIVGMARGGIYDSGSIIWSDKSELKADALFNVDQIVGHTSSNFIDIHFDENRNANLYFIDKRGDKSTFSIKLNL